MLRKLKSIIGILIRTFARIAGIEIQRSQDIDLELIKLNSIKGLNKRLGPSEQLVHRYPEHPKPHFELAKYMTIAGDPRLFKQLDKCAKVWKEWLRTTGLQKLDIEFIQEARVVGSLGNHFGLEILLKANQCGIRVPKKPFILLPSDTQLRNQALFSYFEPYLNIIRDEEAIQKLRSLESLLALPLGIGLPMDDGCPFLDFAANMVELEMENQGLKSVLFELNDEHRKMGEQVLKEIGLPKNAWYVTLHVREPGYRGETPKNTTENWRNCNPQDYMKACKVITDAGGWVFRMGDPSMTPLPPMPQVIDYALSDIRTDWMDVFLGATCRFLIGTGSGYYHIPSFFGVPCILTNFPGFVPYYGIRSQDLYLPRWLKNSKTGDLISFEDYMSPPVANFSSEQNFIDANLQWIENTPEELEAVTKEMLLRTDKNISPKIYEDKLQLRFKDLAEACGHKYGYKKLKAFASISQDFINKYSDLI